MKLRRLLGLIASNLRQSRVRALLAMIGIVVGTGLLVFFIGLGQGLRERVLNRIFPVNQLEIEPRAVQVFGTEQHVGQEPLDDSRVAQVARLPGVVRAFGKQKSSFPARLWGGKELIGYNLFTEAFFDGMPVAMLRSELEEFEDLPAKLRKAAKHKPQRCDVDLDCAPGSTCRDGACSTVVYAEQFVESGAIVLPCASDAECLGATTCQTGRCAPKAQAGVPAREPPRRCMLPAPAGNGRELDFAHEVGVLAHPCGESGAVDGWCRTEGKSCPPQQYCAGDHPDTVPFRNMMTEKLSSACCWHPVSAISLATP